MKHLVIGKTNNGFIQFFRYFWVGGSSAIVDLVIFSLCIYWLDIAWAYSAFIGYMVGLAWNYVISIIWVFESKSKLKEIIAVFFIALGGLLWTWLLLWIMIDNWYFNEALAKAISQVLILAWNFGMRKWVVF